MRQVGRDVGLGFPLDPNPSPTCPQSRDDAELCAICFDRKLEVTMVGAGGAPCGHQMCAGCAFQLCGRGLDAPTCPFCRADIGAFKSAQT